MLRIREYTEVARVGSSGFSPAGSGIQQEGRGVVDQAVLDIATAQESDLFASQTVLILVQSDDPFHYKVVAGDSVEVADTDLFKLPAGVYPMGVIGGQKLIAIVGA